MNAREAQKKKALLIRDEKLKLYESERNKDEGEDIEECLVNLTGNDTIYSISDNTKVEAERLKGRLNAFELACKKSGNNERGLSY